MPSGPPSGTNSNVVSCQVCTVLTFMPNFLSNTFLFDCSNLETYEKFEVLAKLYNFWVQSWQGSEHALETSLWHKFQCCTLQSPYHLDLCENFSFDHFSIRLLQLRNRWQIQTPYKILQLWSIKLMGFWTGSRDLPSKKIPKLHSPYFIPSHISFQIPPLHRLLCLDK